MVQVRVLPGDPVKPLTLIPLPVRLLALPLTGSLKATRIPVICHGRSVCRVEFIRLYDCVPKRTSISETVGARVSIAMFARYSPS